MSFISVFSCRLSGLLFRLGTGLLLFHTVSAQEYLDSQKKELAIGVQHAIYRGDFASADSLGRQLCTQYADDPIGPFSRAAVLLSVMMDREEPVENERFFELLKKTDSLAAFDEETSLPNTHAWMAYHRGHVKTYRALWEARFGSKLQAVRFGYAARSEYESGLERDSGCYDLYFGLGLYHYWKSAKGGILRRLCLLKNEMARGIAELQLAADSSAISREASRNALIWIWLDREQYDSVITLSTQMAERFPEGKLFLWPMALAYMESGEQAKAAEIYNRLRSMLAVNPGNYYNLIECNYQLYHCYDELDMNDEARSVAQRAGDYVDEIPKETRRRQRSKLAYLSRAARR